MSSPAAGAAPGALDGRRVLLIVSGGIAAFKALELVRLLRARGCAVRCVLTDAAAHFVTPLSLQALSEAPVHTTLWSLTDEQEMGHIALSRLADLLVVCPASADILARMAAGLASDLATTLLLATDKPVLVAPAMNVRMWAHPATQDNMALLRRRGVHVVGPTEGAMACNEFGFGRLSEPPEIVRAIEAVLADRPGMAVAGDGAAPPDLAGRHVLVTAGPTHEPIDPVRFLGNRSSGRQGYAIAGALARRGARVTLVSGPVALIAPPAVDLVPVQTAEDMLRACLAALPADAAVMTAAVADWRAASPNVLKIRKVPGAPPPAIALTLNPDILATIAAPGPSRPRLVVGFAAETGDLRETAAAKRLRKRCDWILANEVGAGSDVMGGTDNEIHLITEAGTEDWPRMPKDAVAEKLAARMAVELADR
ncbi:bifunctional phosphopantothenoylcysteine decarboxylase/phosphopantothenate--cysteine ligase CoaBC [Rhizosaccharibacter radicis]|uniref:Coenzyme A biosynthesis bifunctional protein CoaBC n=1 Tax=Rhizosaccharibacter radicis TaxID=2782605 RepID=A0ABT1VXX9_9PROT|nr:bifunctional phosphopantothenoylcysteine decarboxylase/phosphopantothenate--cysteine ligase CoaBC [Acetobacteraceae bacterium KSS12]